MDGIPYSNQGDKENSTRPFLSSCATLAIGFKLQTILEDFVMFHLSFLIDLPKPDTIDTASLTPEDAAVKLRQAAILRLNGTQGILLVFRRTLSWL